MIYQFLTDEDLSAIMKDVFIKAAMDNDLRLIKRAEAIAVQVVKDKIRFRYDISVIFPFIPQWTAAVAFSTGDYCYDEGIIYVASGATTGEKPRSTPAKWTVSDPREPLVVSKCSEIAIYHIFQRVSPRKMPDNIKEDYKCAMRWLNEIRDSMESPDLPVVEDDIDELSFGGPEVQDMTY